MCGAVAEADRFLAKVTPTPKPNCPQFKSCKKCVANTKSTCRAVASIAVHCALCTVDCATGGPSHRWIHVCEHGGPLVGLPSGCHPSTCVLCVCAAGLPSLCGWCPFKATLKTKGHCVNIANRNADNKLCPITNNTILLQYVVHG